MTTSPEHEEAGEHRSFNDAVAHAIGITGTTVTSAGTILAGTFAVPGIAGGSSEAQPLGFGIASGPHPREPVAAEIREPRDA